MNTRLKKGILLGLSSALILFLICFSFPSKGKSVISKGYLSCDDVGGNYLYLEKYDLRLSGVENKGCTYFLLPAYVSLTEIDQSLSFLKLYETDGSLLSVPMIGSEQEILVHTSKGEVIPWKICFLQSENLNTVILNSIENGIDNIEHDDYISMSAKIMSPDGVSQFDEVVSIKGRGNDSWTGSKKPYQILLNKQTSLCGMKPSRKWVLLANYLEPTKIYNKMAFDMSEEIGLEYAIESDWVDLYADGVYIGNYLLCKEPQIGRYDLDIGNLEKLNASYFMEGHGTFATDDMKGYTFEAPFSPSTGGYLLEKNTRGYYEEKDCGFKVAEHFFTIKSPDNAPQKQVEYIADIFQHTDDILRNDTSDYSSVIDEASFARRFLVEEMMFNYDAFVTSYYFYKKTGSDKLFSGPAWDYDMAVGEARGAFQDYDNTILDDISRFESDGEDVIEFKNPLDWDNLLYEDESYRNYLVDVFKESLPVFNEFIEKRIDDYYGRIQASVKMDYIVWGRGRGAGNYDDPYNNIRYTKFFLSKRVEYLCNKWGVDGQPSYDFTDGTKHTVFLKWPDGTSTEMTVSDGEQISPETLPAYDDSVYSGWYYRYTEYIFSYFVPVFEDVTVELRLRD